MSETFAADPSLDLFIHAARGKKAMDIVVMDLRGMTAVTDYFIICSGRSSRQVMAIAEHIQKELRNNRVRPLGVEGQSSGHWILLDYDHVVIHVFYDPVRRFYNLEGLWADVPKVQIAGSEMETTDLEDEEEETDDAPEMHAHHS